MYDWGKKTKELNKCYLLTYHKKTEVQITNKTNNKHTNTTVRKRIELSINHLIMFISYRMKLINFLKSEQTTSSICAILEGYKSITLHVPERVDFHTYTNC